MPVTDKPYSAAADRNREPILAVLRRHLTTRAHVLEIGSGTGQHAVYFADALSQLVWQPSDRRENLPGIAQWRSEARLRNVLAPLELDVKREWPRRQYEVIYSANTLHIMSWPEVQRLFAKLPEVMTAEARLVLYGPFNYGGQFTSDSNAEFDRSLRQSASHRGIRDFEAVDQLAQAAGLRLLEDCAMPANNRCLVWQRTSATTTA